LIFRELKIAKGKLTTRNPARPQTNINMAAATTKSAAPPSFRQELAATAAAIVASGKGILAADESTGTIGKRFAGIGVENVEENRRAYRELLFTSGAGLPENIGGVILFEETLDQKTADGTPFTKVLSDAGIIIGIKVDKVRYQREVNTIFLIGNCKFAWD
jgi:hypothetical protein